jgi:hypothetical protein
VLLYVGILIGLCLGIGIILVSIIGVFLVRRWRRHFKKQMRKKYFQKNQGLLLEQLILSDQNTNENTKIFSYEESQKATDDFDPTRICLVVEVMVLFIKVSYQTNVWWP